MKPLSQVRLNLRLIAKHRLKIKPGRVGANVKVWQSKLPARKQRRQETRVMWGTTVTHPIAMVTEPESKTKSTKKGSRTLYRKRRQRLMRNSSPRSLSSRSMAAMKRPILQTKMTARASMVMSSETISHSLILEPKSISRMR